MFESISWSEYLHFLLIALFIYYPLVGLLFYRKELAALVKKGSGGPDDVPGLSSLSFGQENENKLLEELREVHHATTHREFPKEELMLTIIQKVKQYSGVNKELINQFMEEAFPELEDRDRRRIWQ
jgi:predicted house-cleaning noncanonical NTP pyrophosphatase (MazG superfamily)